MCLMSVKLRAAARIRKLSWLEVPQTSLPRKGALILPRRVLHYIWAVSSMKCSDTPCGQGSPGDFPSGATEGCPVEQREVVEVSKKGNGYGCIDPSGIVALLSDLAVASCSGETLVPLRLAKIRLVSVRLA